MRGLDFSSWQAIGFTILGLAVITIVGIGIRLLIMQTIQQKRERENRQINERLRTLILAYKTLGGSFTGNISVSPIHLKDIKRKSKQNTKDEENFAYANFESVTERARRIRDSVEAALSDIILLGTDEQVRLAAVAASELVSGREIHTAELVISLRDFIRKTLGLAPIPDDLSIPKQGPARPTVARGKTENSNQEKGDRNSVNIAGGGMGMAGAGVGMGVGFASNDTSSS